MSHQEPLNLPGPDAGDEDHYEVADDGTNHLVIYDTEDPTRWVKADFYGTLNDVR